MLNKFKSFFSFKKKSSTLVEKESVSFLEKKINFPKDINSLQDLKNFEEAKIIFSTLENQAENKKLMFVGGCVRKLVNRELINDIDIATNLTPDETKKILKEKNIKFIETGLDHGTITVIINNIKFEITTLRKDVHTDGRHAKVEFTTDWALDSQRRDFTFNAIYSNLSGEIYDPLNGLEDLKNGIVKFIGDPNKRIKEDYLRILRYFRFFTQYSKIQHDSEAIKAINKNLEGITKISKERIIDEFYKILNLKNFEKLFKNKFSSSIILNIFPQLKYFDRLNVINSLPDAISYKIDVPLILSVLLIDNTDNCEFFLYKYKFSNQDKERILFLLSQYKKINFTDLLDEKTIIKFAYLHKKTAIFDLLIFSIFVSKDTSIKAIEKQIDLVSRSKLPTFPITGYYLISQCGFSEGPELGSALKKLEQSWIENDFVINKNEIKKILDQFNN